MSKLYVVQWLEIDCGGVLAGVFENKHNAVEYAENKKTGDFMRQYYEIIEVELNPMIKGKDIANII